ncbi:DinB family protein [Streptomyces sp. NPDC002018]|uniref:DinB family protein n=1 Tax=Streptomyces sp. NPDC002018 TaxID=3364629 RepID=UPI00368DED06
MYQSAETTAAARAFAGRVGPVRSSLPGTDYARRKAIQQDGPSRPHADSWPRPVAVPWPPPAVVGRGAGACRPWRGWRRTGCDRVAAQSRSRRSTVGASDDDSTAPPPFTTIAWRLSHLAELLTLRADHTVGSHSLTREDCRSGPDAEGAVAALDAGAAAWREALLSADDAALDTVGYSAYPYGSDPDDPFIDIVWWVNQELLHHGAEIALIRDLYRARQG